MYQVCHYDSRHCRWKYRGLTERQAKKKLQELAKEVHHKLKRGATSFQIPYQANEYYHYHEEVQ